MIAACIDPDDKKRPSTACVKNHLLAFQEVLKGVMKSDEARSSDTVDSSQSSNFQLKNAKFEKAYESFAASVSFKAEPDESFQENERR